MADLGSLSVKMGLESAQFIAGMKAAAAQSQATNAAISKAMTTAKGAVIGLMGAISIDAFVGAARAAFDYADSIVDLADRTGATTKSIQELRYAAQMSGSGIADADGALEKFAKNLGTAQSGGKAMQDVFAGLHVTSQDFDQALRQTIAGISQLPSVSQRNAAALQIFGKSAGTLTALMGEGTKGFDEFADKANELGLVLGDDLLRNAGQINDRLDTMKMILDAKFANAIIQNADAIGNMADSLVNLVSALANFWGQNPAAAMAIMGALAGGAAGGMVGGLPGAAAGAVGGAALGLYAGSEMRGERQKLTDRRAGLVEQNSKKGGLFGIGALPADAPLRKKNEAQIKAIDAQLALMDRQEAAQAAAQRQLQSGANGGTLPTSRASGKGGGKSAEDLAKEARQKLAGYLGDLDGANLDLLSATQALTSDVTDQAALEREMLEIETKRRKAAIDNDVADGRYTRAQGDALKAIEDKIDYAKADLVNLRENEALSKEAQSIRSASIGNERDLLSSGASLARTSADRRDISLRLLDLQYQQEKLALDAIMASKTSTAAEKSIAEARLGVLDRLKANDTATINRDTAGPLAGYLDAIPKTKAEIAESMESAAVDGLGVLQTGLKDTITGVGDLGDAFLKVGDLIIGKMMDIALQQLILAPLGDLLGGLGGLLGGAGGGAGNIVMGGAFNAFTGARANGGLTRSGRYLVGERGPEIVDVGNTASTVPNHALRSINGAAAGGGMNITFGSITSNDPAAVKMLATQAILEAMPLITQQSTAAAMAKMRRPSM